MAAEIFVKLIVPEWSAVKSADATAHISNLVADVGAEIEELSIKELPTIMDRSVGYVRNTILREGS